MRCVTCGLPLSPVRKICPRCGTTIIHHDGKPLTTASGVVSSVMQDMFKPPEASKPGDAQDGAAPTSYQYHNAEASLPQQVAPQAVSNQSAIVEKSAPHLDLVNAPMPSWREMADVPKVPVHAHPPQKSPVEGAFTMGKAPTFSLSFVQILQKRSLRFNLIIATLCVLSGAMLLITVFIMSLSLPSPSAQVTMQSAQRSSLVTTPGIAHLAPNLSAVPVIQPTASPAPSYAGQQYIDNAQMASYINFNTAQPLQLTTQFYKNQKIYVTFALHPGRSGAACLLWYLNNQEFTAYTFSVDNVAISAYSYAISGVPGSGYVEIYWASSTMCADKVLAQKVSFTVV